MASSGGCPSFIASLPRILDTGEVHRFDGLGELPSIRDGLQLLRNADELWGHNIIGYDIEAIKELFPKWSPKGLVRDTLILSRLLFTDIRDRDFRSRPANMPANLYGRHSLESWGHRLNVHKSEFGKTLNNDWSTYSPEMLEYCAQDVVVSVELVKLFEPKLELYADAIETEHKSAEILAAQETSGFPFDVEGAQRLESKLRTEMEQLSDQMRDTFAFVDGGEMTPKRNNKTKGYFEGCPFTKLKDFNPTSRFHIAWAFQTFRGWEPTELTDAGKAKDR